MLQHIADEADRRMGIYRAQPPPELPEGVPTPPPPPELPEGTVDAPLVRLYNFLRAFIHGVSTSQLIIAAEMMSLSYQLEVLFLQVHTLLTSFASCTERDRPNGCAPWAGPNISEYR